MSTFKYALPLLPIASSVTGQPADPTLADALSLLQRGDATGAIGILEAVTKREPFSSPGPVLHRI